MDLMNKQVSHKKFGAGTVEGHDAGIITVRFGNETKKFQYPLAFESFLELTDADLSKEIKEAIELKKEEMRKEEMMKADLRQSKLAQKAQNTAAAKSSKPKPSNRSSEILSIHKSCLDFLISYQNEHKDFYFVPRRMNRNNRLDDGYYFIGNDDYLMVSFWNGGDGIEKIHNLNFGITKSGTCFMEISSRDSEIKAGHLRELVRILEEKNHCRFDEVKVNKWRLDYADGLPYLEVLEGFINNEKAAIDEYLKMNEDAGIELANQELHDKYVKKIIEKQMQ